MKNCATALAMLAMLTASLALAEDFKTINGKEYKDATVSRVEPDGIVLRMKSGIVKLYFSELPKEVQERLDHAGAKANTLNIPSQTTVKEVKPPKLSAAIAKLQRQGLLRVDCIEPDAKAWIRHRTLERVGCAREGERDKEFGRVLSSAASIDLDFR